MRVNVFNPFLFRYWHYAQSEQYSSTARTIHRYIIHNITKKKTLKTIVYTSREANPRSLYSRKTFWPKPLRFYENDARELIFAHQEVLSRLWILFRKMSVPQAIPSWTGFVISVRDNVVIVNTAIGYLDCIDASA